MAGGALRMGSGSLQLVKELSKPVWVVQKQPANHCLKSCGPSINRGVSPAGSTTGTVPPPAHPGQLLFIQQFFLLKPGQHCGLSVSTNIRNNSFVQCVGLPRTQPMTQPLVQFPDCIPDPGQLQRSECFATEKGRLTPNPVAQAASWLRAVGRSGTRCRNSSRRTSLIVCVTREFPTRWNDRF